MTLRFPLRFAAPVLALMLAPAWLVAQAPAPTPAPAPAGTIAGKWTLTSEVANGPSTLEIKLDGTKVTGTLVGGNGNFTIAGEYKEEKLTFSMDYQGQGTIVFTAKLDKDGALDGTMEYGQGPVAWKALRQKD